MKNLDPIIILSAAPRMGTTLVQRLLCSAKDCLIYGDTIGNDAAFLISYLNSKEFAVRSQSYHSDPMLAPLDISAAEEAVIRRYEPATRHDCAC